MVAGVINTGSHPKLLWPGVYTTWGQVYNEHHEEFTELYDVRDSDKAYETAVQVTGFGLAPVKPEGTSITNDSELQGILTNYVHVPYALGYQVTYEEQRDNLYEEVSMRRAKANAFSMRQTIETSAAFIYNNAFNNTYFTTGDGVALVSNAHVAAVGGTYSNALTPSADLSEAALEDVVIQAMQFKTDRGLFINIMPRSLIIPPQEWANAHRILKSVLQNDTSNNAINVLNATNAFPEGIKLNHYLTQPHAWFVRTNCPEGMTFFWRDHPDLAQDNDFSTKNLMASCYMRFSMGCTDPRGIIGSNGP